MRWDLGNECRQAQDDQEAPPLAKRKKGAGQPVSDDSMEEDDTNETPVASASHPTEDAKTVAQTSNPASGGLSNSKTPRRRVVRTTMDKKGIEVRPTRKQMQSRFKHGRLEEPAGETRD